MATTVIGVFDDWSGAERVVDDLMKAGFRREDVSILSNRERGPDLRAAGDTPNIGPVEDIGGSGKDAGAGAAIGGMAGFVAGIAALAIPGIGPILAAGPLASGIVGAAVGAAAGGLIGNFTNVGVSEEEAELYEEHVRRGGTLVAVNTEEQIAHSAVDIMNRHGAIDIENRAHTWREQGWTGRAPVRTRDLDLGDDAGRIRRIPADQVGRARATEGGAKMFVW